MKQILIVNGIHGAGKSAIAQLFVKQNKGYAFFPEIGGFLRQQVGSNALSSNIGFDREVMSQELLRDREIEACKIMPLIETWHIGNLAYARVRNPQLFSLYCKKLEPRLKRFQPLAILITINWKLFRERSTEKIRANQMNLLIDFYNQVLRNLGALYYALNIPHIKIPNEASLGEAVDNLEQGVKKHKYYPSAGAPATGNPSLLK